MAALLLAGCAATPDGRTADGPQDARDELRIIESTAVLPESEDLFFQVLVGEFAGVRGQLTVALEAYLRAMALSDDPEIASRATRISIFANQDEQGQQAATRWVELAPNDSSARLALGVFHLRKGDASLAREQFRELVQRADYPADAFAQLGGALGREEDQGAAVDALRSLAQSFSEVPEAHLVHAQAALRANDPKSAVEAADAGLRVAPDSRELSTLRAQALVESEREDSGILAFEALVERYPEDAELRLYLARTLLSARREDEALSQFQRVLEDRPNDANVLYATGLLTLEAGHPEMAQPYFERLLELGERNNEASMLLGQIAEDMGKREEALQWYGQAKGDARLTANLRRSILLGELGRVDEARQVLADVRRQHPGESVRSFMIEGEILRRNGQLGDAMVMYSDALERHAGNVDLTYGRALIAVFQDDVDAAERDLRSILESEPDNPNALNALGFTLVDLTDRVEEGFALIERAYSMDPDNPAVIDSMGWAYYRKGDNSQALRYLRRAYALMPDAEIAAHLGEVLWVEGMREEARSVWSEARDKAPDDPALNETMQRLDP